MKRLAISFALILLLHAGIAGATDYYVDYDGGNDTNSGLSPSSAWKHSPGDDKASGTPSTTTLQPGDIVHFKGGVVYRGSIYIDSSGAAGNPITFKGTGWEPGRGIIDGSEIFNTVWTPCDSSCGANWESIYYTPSYPGYDFLSTDLYDEQGFLFPAQDPNIIDPFWQDNIAEFRPVSPANLGRTYIRDPSYFTQADPDFWNESYVLIWVNPNVVATMKITSFDPSSSTIYFDDLGPTAIYGDRDQYYSVINALSILDRPGEYYYDKTNQRIYVWPRSLPLQIETGTRNKGIQIGYAKHIAIDGLIIQKHTGTSGAYSILNIFNDEPVEDILITNNEIRYNRLKSGGQPGTVKFDNAIGIRIINSSIHDNQRMTGVLIIRAKNVAFFNNTLFRNGYKGLWLMGTEWVEIINNRFSEHKGTHGTDISVFTSKDVLIAGNIIANSQTETISFEVDENLIIHNNILIGDGRNAGVVRLNGNDMRGYLVLTNNVAHGSGNNVGFNIVKSSNASAQYIVKNNIVDGWLNCSVVYDVSNNIYTGLSWQQQERYGWHLMPGEFVETNLSKFLIPQETRFREATC